MTPLPNPIRCITPCSTSQGRTADYGSNRATSLVRGRLTNVVVSLAGGTIYRNLKHLCAPPESTRKHTSTRKVRQQHWSLLAEGVLL
jgi:hypothetical protein